MGRRLERAAAFVAGRPSVDYAAIALLAAAVLVPMLWGQGLWDPYESHVAEVAREAAQEGRWLPLAYDRSPLPSLPPLFFWIEAAWMKLAGTGELAVRLPLVILGLLWLLFVRRAAGRALGRGAALLLAAALATSPFFYGGARHTGAHLFAAMCAFGSVLAAAARLAGGDGEAARKKGARARWRRAARGAEEQAHWLLLGAAFLSGGVPSLLYPLLSLLAAAVVAATGLFPSRSLGRLWSLPGFLLFAVPSALWVGAGAAASGAPFFAGLLDPRPLVFGAMRALVVDELFTAHVANAGHMLYPWIILFPAGLYWVFALGGGEGEREEARGRRAMLAALLAGGPVLLLLACGLAPGVGPLDMIAAPASLAAIGAWGLARAHASEGDLRARIPLSLGALLVVLGAGSMGVDWFWETKRAVEVTGYFFDRPYPALHDVVKAVYNFVAIMAGAGAASLLFFRRRAALIGWVLAAAATCAALFSVHYVHRRCGESFTAGPLAAAYAPAARAGDVIATYEMDPQARGGEVFYFGGAARHLATRGDLRALMAARAGKGRIVFVTSHVRTLYNDVFAESCGVRIKTLNEKRQWYAIATWEGPPPVDPGAGILGEGAGAPAMAGARETRFHLDGKSPVAFLGFNASAQPGGGAWNSSGGPLKAKRGGWLDVELFWRSEEALAESWKVHLDAVSARKGKVQGSLTAHHLPACGAAPLYEWKPGDVVRDFSRLYFPLDSSPGAWEVRTGLFAPDGRKMKAPGKPTPAQPAPPPTLTVISLFKVEVE